jgi:thiamine kinase-like enzyme
MVWPQGGHTSLANRPSDEVDRVAAGFDRLRANFPAAEASADFLQPAAELGIRLQRVARQVDQWLAESTCTSLVHGDFKAGNLFVKNEDAAAPEICVIDWQWTGWNVPQHDIIYFLSSSVDDECVADWRGLLQHYHEILVASLHSCTGDQGHRAGEEQEETSSRVRLPFEETVRLFQLTVLDYMRWALAYRLVDET